MPLDVISYLLAEEGLGEWEKTRVIAAADSKVKKGHYVCDGSDDQNEINQAIMDL